MVIQRWQSLLLLVAAVMMGCYTFCSLAQVQTELFTLDFKSMGFSYEGEATAGGYTGTFLGTWYFFTLSLTTTLLFIVDIFLYGNPVTQRRICFVGILMLVATVATGYCAGYNAVVGMQQIEWSSVAYVAPFLAVVSAIFASNRIQSDLNKLRAADRIR